MCMTPSNKNQQHLRPLLVSSLFKLGNDLKKSSSRENIHYRTRAVGPTRPYLNYFLNVRIPRTSSTEFLQIEAFLLWADIFKA